MMTERMVFGPFAGTSAGWSAARSSSRMTEHGRAPAGAAPERHGGSVLRALLLESPSGGGPTESNFASAKVHFEG